MSGPRTRPDPMSEYHAWQALGDAIGKGTELLPLGVGSRGGPFEGAPPSASHRTYQCEPGDEQFLGRMRADDSDDETERDIVLCKQMIKVELRHDYVPGDHDGSYKLATDDAWAARIAILNRPEAAWLQPELQTSKPVRQGHTILQTMQVMTTYERLLPPVLE